MRQAWNCFRFETFWGLSFCDVQILVRGLSFQVISLNDTEIRDMGIPRRNI